MRLMGIDVGTTSVKSAVYDEKLNLIQGSAVAYELKSQGKTVELEAEKYWEIVSNEIKKLKIKPDALSLDTQCETIILADEEGNPLRNAIVWLDSRAGKEAELIEKHFGRKKVYEICGQPEITAAWPACKLLWIKNNEPEIWKKTRKIFLLEDYLLFKLTGEFVTEKTLQSSSLYFDIRCGGWWDEMLEFIGIDEKMLPEIKNSGEYIGDYNGIKICTGAMDQVSGAVGAGVLDNGTVSETTGTAMVIFMPWSNIPEYDEKSIVPCHYNYNGKYCLLSWTPTAGMALEWFKRNFCEGNSFKELDALAEKVPPGSEGLVFLPYLCGSSMPKYNTEARASFTGIGLEHKRGHFVRSIMESVACLLKSNLDYLKVDASEIRSLGGGAKSELWCRIKSDISGKTLVTLEENETARLGAAIFAGVGAGIFTDVESAAKEIKIKKTYAPDNSGCTDLFSRYFETEKLLNK